MYSLKSFASDNNAPVHDAVMRAIIEANQGDAIGYGDDIHTLETEKLFRKHFGANAKVFPVLTGTGANVAAIGHIARPYQAVVCADKAHLENDECGAPEKGTGCKLLTLAAPDGKINSGQIIPLLKSVGFQHHVQPKVISLTQSTEMGTVYQPGELKEISAFAREHGLYLHLDGARLANAAAALDLSLAALTSDAGIDVLSFGGTKNGAMAAEAVVFLNPELAEGFEYTRKQSMQLASKMRFISAQFNALLSDDLWLINARHANNMAAVLSEKAGNISGVTITQKVETNAVFASLPASAIEKLQRQYYFYTWDAEKNEVRWMTSYKTSENDIDDFVSAIGVAMK